MNTLIKNLRGRRVIWLVLLLAVALLVAACGEDEPDPVTVQVILGDDGGFYYMAPAGVDTPPDPNEEMVIQVEADVPVVFEVLNQGTIEHTFTVDAFGIDVHVDAGETATSEVFTLEAGTYEAYCAIPGHRAAGQVATLIVE